MILDYSSYLDTLNDVEKKHCPKNFFCCGDISLLETERRISVIGSRRVSKEGASRAKKISEYLIQEGITIVSGLAEGVDTIAHRTAINNNGKTIAVIGTPMNQYYPKTNRDLQDYIASKHLLVSQFPIGSVICSKNFPMRNRTMALITDATIIVEATESSGTKYQAWEALRLGRKLFLMENLVKQKNVYWVKDMLYFGAEILNKNNYKSLIKQINTSKQKSRLPVASTDQG